MTAGGFCDYHQRPLNDSGWCDECGEPTAEQPSVEALVERVRAWIDDVYGADAHAALDSLTAALEDCNLAGEIMQSERDKALAALERAEREVQEWRDDAELKNAARAQKAEAVVEAARVYRKAVLGDHGQELTDAILGFEAALTAYDETP